MFLALFSIEKIEKFVNTCNHTKHVGRERVKGEESRECVQVLLFFWLFVSLLNSRVLCVMRDNYLLSMLDTIVQHHCCLDTIFLSF